MFVRIPKHCYNEFYLFGRTYRYQTSINPAITLSLEMAAIVVLKRAQPKVSKSFRFKFSTPSKARTQKPTNDAFTFPPIFLPCKIAARKELLCGLDKDARRLQAQGEGEARAGG